MITAIGPTFTVREMCPIGYRIVTGDKLCRGEEGPPLRKAVVKVFG